SDGRGWVACSHAAVEIPAVPEKRRRRVSMSGADGHKACSPAAGNASRSRLRRMRRRESMARWLFAQITHRQADACRSPTP
ncbi:MAG: hypothetical protein WBC44_08370, partial [Planctomycetaceae bacterium]